MEHRILIKVNSHDTDWSERYSALSGSGKALWLAVMEAREDPAVEVTSHGLAQALGRRWAFPHEAIATAMAELIDADFISVVRRRASRRGSPAQAA